MFKKLQNIDLAFRFVRNFCAVMVVVCAVIACTAIIWSTSLVKTMQGKVYILASGKAIEAFAADQRDNVPVEARDHVKVFHHNFFTLSPDDKAIAEGVARSLYLADGSAKRAYDDLQEKGYFAGIISGNISQEIRIDSVDITLDPFSFRCFATQTITRPATVTQRSLVTEGALRFVGRSDHNPHGLLIERWSIIDNRDIKTENR